jgi:hypothetical protein
MVNDDEILNKRNKALKESAILALRESQIYNNHFTINSKTIGMLDSMGIKIIINPRI